MNQEEVKKKHDEFVRLLLKTPLEEYTSQLWESFRAAACGEVDLEAYFEDLDEQQRERKEGCKRLAQQLLPLLKNEPVKAGGVTITDSKALEALRESLLASYRAAWLDKRELTFEEAQRELKNWRNDEGVKNWIVEALREWCDEALPGENVSISPEDIDDFCENPGNVEYYAETTLITEEVTPEQVEQQIRLNSAPRKKGRPIKNHAIMWLFLEIRRHYKGQRNKDLRLFFDCLDLFGWVDDVKVDWAKKYDTESKLNAAKASYIRSIYNQAKRL